MADFSMNSLSSITASAKAALSDKRKEKKKAKIAKRECTFCKQTGHLYTTCPIIAADEPQEFDPLKGCNNCGNPGHWASECRMDQHVALITSKIKRCTFCKKWNHLSFECPQKRKQTGKAFSLNKQCRICGNVGHWARECVQSQNTGSQKVKICKWCGATDHLSFECKSRNKLVNRRRVHADKLKRLNLYQQEYYRREREGTELSLHEQKRRSVVEIKNIPMGLEEVELIKFFKQFGFVTRCNLQRTAYGKSLGVAYLEFGHHDVGPIVTETMDTTALYDHFIEVNDVPPELVDGKSMFPRRRIEHAKINNKWNIAKHRWENVARIANLEMGYTHFYRKMIEDEEEINDNLKQHGIDYEFHGMREAAAKLSGKRGYVQQLTAIVKEHELNPFLNAVSEDGGDRKVDDEDEEKEKGDEDLMAEDSSDDEDSNGQQFKWRNSV